MKQTILNIDNMDFLSSDDCMYGANLVYADMMYENTDFSWVDLAVDKVSHNGVFIIQTDWHSVAELKVHMNQHEHLNLLNWCIYINDWGGTPTKAFPRKHDDILIYTRGDYKWYPDKIRIPKATAGTAFDKKGTGLKVPCDVFYDKVSFSTVSNERIKFDGKCFKYQKPRWLYDRIIAPFLDEGDLVLDLFMGSGTLGLWCKDNNMDYIGIEYNQDVFNLAKEIMK